MNFTNALIPVDTCNIVMYGQKLKLTTCVKFLGIHIDYRLRFTAHLNHMQTAYNINRVNILKLRSFDPSFLISLYKTFIRPHFEYACTAKLCLPKTITKKLEVLQNKCLRHARYCTSDNTHCSNVELRRQFNMDSVETRILKLASKWMENAMTNNDDIQAFISNHPTDSSNHTPLNIIKAFNTTS